MRIKAYVKSCIHIYPEREGWKGKEREKKRERQRREKERKKLHERGIDGVAALLCDSFLIWLQAYSNPRHPYSIIFKTTFEEFFFFQFYLKSRVWG